MLELISVISHCLHLVSVRDVSVEGQEPLPELVEGHCRRSAQQATGAAAVVVAQATAMLLLPRRLLHISCYSCWWWWSCSSTISAGIGTVLVVAAAELALVVVLVEAVHQDQRLGPASPCLPRDIAAVRAKTNASGCLLAGRGR